MKMSELRSYVRSIRNLEKRRYAEDYVAAVTSGREPPERAGYRVSVMGAQAVELAVAEIRRNAR